MFHFLLNLIIQRKPEFKKNHDTNAVCPSEKTHAQYFGVNFVKTTQGAITQLDSRGWQNVLHKYYW